MAGAANSRSRLAIGAGAVIATILIGALLVTLGSSSRGMTSAVVVGQPSDPAAGGTAALPAEKAGLSVGFTHNRDGATGAAVAYTTAPQRWLYFTDQQITDAVTAIATPAAGPRLAEETVNDVRTARQRLGSSSGRVWWLVRPLAWRVDAQANDDASVSVWILTILSAQDVAAPQTEFATVTVELAWVDGDWRVDGVRDIPGPTPMTGPNDQPWDAGPFDKSLTGFTRMDGEPLR